RAADARARVAQARAETTASQAEVSMPTRPTFDGGEAIPGLIGVSAHDAVDLAAARALKADFAVLGHVLDTPSHSGQPGLGWARFGELAGPAGLPVFAIGGQSEA